MNTRGNNDDEIVYEDVDDNGNSIKPKNYKTEPDPARQGKTPRQKNALLACRMTQFSSRNQHKAFKEIEDLSIGADGISYLAGKWIDNGITFWADKNKVQRIFTMDNLIKYLNNQVKYNAWFDRFGKNLLEMRKEEAKKILAPLLLNKVEYKEPDNDVDI